MELSIDWNVRPELIEGWNTPNMYGLLFVSGLILGYFVIKRIFKKENIPEEMLDKLVMYMVLAIIIGARLGHVIFYGPHFDLKDSMGNVIEEGYFSHPLNIFKVWEGGLASHGAVLAIIIVLEYFSKKVIHKPMLWILDRISISAAITSCFIRLANLVNSEIVGDVTTVPWGIRFLQNSDDLNRLNMEGIPIPVRHPTQLYEAIVYFLIFILLMFLFWKKEVWRKPGIIFGTLLILVFTARFIIEFVKLGQSEWDSTLSINTGQMLSVPFVLVGIIVLFRALKKTAIVD